MDSSVVRSGGRIPAGTTGTSRRRGRGAAWLLLLPLILWSGQTVAVEKVFGGVGLQVVPTIKGELVVLRVVSGAPADEGGLLPGDLIVAVDDFSLEGSNFSEVVSRYLWGEAGTPVTLKYLRPGLAGLQSVILHRVSLNPEASRTLGVKMLTPDSQ